MQRRTCGHRKDVHNIPSGIVRPAQEPLVSPSRNTVNAFRANDNIITHPPTNKYVEDVDNKTAVLETPVEKFNLTYLADYLTGKQSLTPVSDDVIKICRDRLDLPD